MALLDGIVNKIRQIIVNSEIPPRESPALIHRFHPTLNDLFATGNAVVTEFRRKTNTMQQLVWNGMVRLCATPRGGSTDGRVCLVLEKVPV